MKRTFQIFIFLMTATGVGQNSGKADEEQIKDLITNTFQEVFSDLDPQSLEIYCTDDFLLLETGEVWDMNKMRDYLRSAQNSRVKRINSFDFIEIKIEGKMAWVAYYNKAEFMAGDKVVKEMNWVESAAAVLTEKGWKLQLLHSTVAKE